MAKVIVREWTSRGPTGRRVRHVGYGYTLTVNGKRERRVSSEWQTEAQAHDALSRRLKEIEAGRITRPAEATLGALAEEYLRYKTAEGKRTVKDDRLIIERRLLPAFGSDLQVRRLTPEAIARYEQRRRGEVTAFTVSNELSVLRHMLRLAKRWGYVEAVPEITMPRKPEGRLRYLDEDEIRRLLDACRESRNPHLWTIVAVALNTGMRRGEVLDLEWERVDLSSARITLYRTKNGTPRGVPINRTVYEALIALEPDAARRRGRLFRKGDDRAWGGIRTAFTLAVKRAGIKDFRFHDLRHTAASHMTMRGASLREIQEVLGHTTMAMTLRYAHLSPAHLRTAVDRLDGLASAPGLSEVSPMAHNARVGGAVPDKSASF